ncbi:hypothetical protein C8R44DRAFT_886791 [Mycena epipterygia]|nr:hypothetical protein C8R44DRAFT_886791 [Mycena epipterygia]
MRAPPIRSAILHLQPERRAASRVGAHTLSHPSDPSHTVPPPTPTPPAPALSRCAPSSWWRDLPGGYTTGDDYRPGLSFPASRCLLPGAHRDKFVVPRASSRSARRPGCVRAGSISQAGEALAGARMRCPCGLRTMSCMSYVSGVVRARCKVSRDVWPFLPFVRAASPPAYLLTTGAWGGITADMAVFRPTRAHMTARGGHTRMPGASEACPLRARLQHHAAPISSANAPDANCTTRRYPRPRTVSPNHILPALLPPSTLRPISASAPCSPRTSARPARLSSNTNPDATTLCRTDRERGLLGCSGYDAGRFCAAAAETWGGWRASWVLVARISCIAGHTTEEHPRAVFLHCLALVAIPDVDTTSVASAAAVHPLNESRAELVPACAARRSPQFKGCDWRKAYDAWPAATRAFGARAWNWGREMRTR